MLAVNFLRNLKSTVPRLISVILITAIAVTVYVALGGIVHNVNRFCTQYYEAQNIADYWISGVKLDRSDCRKLSAIPGVTGVQPRIAYDAHDAGNRSITLSLYAVPDTYEMNIPYLVSGSLPKSDREMVISDEFAKANGLAIGSWYEIEPSGTGQTLRLQISGLIKSAEHIRHVTATTPAADLAHHGFAYLNDTVLSNLMGSNCYNQICLTVEDNMSSEALLRQIDEQLGEKVMSVVALEDNLSAYSFLGNTNDLKPVLNLFPILFFLCAILLMVSNTSRMIENARQEIGTFKALGYYDSTILGYYLLNAVLVVAAGFPLGVLFTKPLIKLVVAALANGCDLPPFAIVHDFGAWGEAFAITAICCIGSAYLVTRASLKECPAECMRPKPPKSTKPVFLEKFPRLWQKLSFHQKYIIRNTLRNKVRMITCMVGIAFCMALVVSAFGLRDAIGRYTDALTSNQNRYDLIVSLDASTTERQYQRLASSVNTGAAEFEMMTACWVYSKDQRTTTTLTVAEDTPALRLYTPYADSPSALPTDGIVLAESSANALHVQVGDLLHLRFIGDAKLSPVRVCEIDRSITGAYISRSLWRSLGAVLHPDDGIY